VRADALIMCWYCVLVGIGPSAEDFDKLLIAGLMEINYTRV